MSTVNLDIEYRTRNLECRSPEWLLRRVGKIPYVEIGDSILDIRYYGYPAFLL
jgi:hypothetical protein